MDFDTLIKEFIAKCKRTENQIECIWEKIILCNFKDGMEDIAMLFTQLETIISYGNSLSENKEFEINIEDILKKLALLENAMAIPDYILVADLVKYEVKPIIAEWRLNISNKFEIYLN